MALVPAQIGLDYTIGFVIEGSHLFIVPLIILMFAYLMGFVARHFISGKRYMLGAFEGALIAFLIFTIAWISISVANENYPLTILTDLHVVFMLAMGIFAGRSFRNLGDFKSLFNFIIIISLLHWIFLIGYFVQQRLYTELLFIMDLIRDIQGSSDLYSPLIPVMLAFISANDNGNRGKIEKLYPFLVFLFSVRTILCLSRGAILQVAVSAVALYFMMPRENRKVYAGLIKRQLVYIAIFCVFIFAVSPSMASFGFKTLGSRIADSGKTARESVSLGSLKYRALETQMVLENRRRKGCSRIHRRRRSRMFTTVICGTC